MKKLFTLIAIIFLVTTTACSSPAEEEVNVRATTICTNGPRIFPEDYHTVLTIESYGENILTWVTNTTIRRRVLKEYLLDGQELSDDEIHKVFDLLNENQIEGFQMTLISLSDNSAVIEVAYDYSLISDEDLKARWALKNGQEITLSSALVGLEQIGSFCTTEFDR